ncbi:hypothetical protein T4B_1610 [Trichinella pseudospiralis]|uniref:Uncharacterized protein n=1 Tax=Trichinella pseudospiralis TaxID=6337 RepID=A0A0V1JX86_TRIPS|nr:hypothetical protein T4A_6482 [Trichinella pseudospiralis]KRZ33211.1 hypothetical protein T4B_1610 [Trichinella pseudospiralis]KRZ39602.1 hypothetical protein T4C_6581 [Trichinella pseudospiralis]
MCKIRQQNVSGMNFEFNFMKSIYNYSSIENGQSSCRLHCLHRILVIFRCQGPDAGTGNIIRLTTRVTPQLNRLRSWFCFSYVQADVTGISAGRSLHRRGSFIRKPALSNCRTFSGIPNAANLTWLFLIRHQAKPPQIHYEDILRLISVKLPYKPQNDPEATQIGPPQIRTAQAISPFLRWSCPQPIAARILPRCRAITLVTSSIPRN